VITSRDNFATTSGSLAEDDVNANRFEMNAACNYNISGRGYLKAATANLSFSAGHTALAVLQMCAFFVMLDSSGNVTTVQSAIVPGTRAVGYKTGAWDWPISSTLCCIGAIIVETRNAATFTPNTTDLGATDVIDTYANVVLDYGQPVTY
jgi:hypothetical protein